MFKLINVIVLIKSMKLKKNNNLDQGYFFSFINSIINQKKRNSFVSSFTISENLFSIIDSISNETELDNSTLASSINFNLLLLIDSKLLDKSDSLLIIRL